MSSTPKISELGTPSPMCSSFYIPQTWHKYYINVIIWKPHIISTSSYDAPMMSCTLLAGKSAHAPGHLIGDSRSEQNPEVDTLITTHHEEGNGSPRHTLWHSPPGTLMCPLIESTRICFIPNMYKNIYSNVRYVKCVQEYIQECIKIKVQILFIWLVWGLSIWVISRLVDWFNGFLWLRVGIHSI